MEEILQREGRGTVLHPILQSLNRETVSSIKNQFKVGTRESSAENTNARFEHGASQKISNKRWRNCWVLEDIRLLEHLQTIIRHVCILSARNERTYEHVQSAPEGGEGGGFLPICLPDPFLDSPGGQ
jgi:hypothetical protein